MSTTIDQRVVEMQFDNKKFEQNVSTSMSTLDKLKQSLNMTGATKGFENLDAAAKNVNMSGLTNAVETVRVKFSALEVMAVTALANITNSAINAGKRIVSSLTIDPISTGFSEYETKINSVQTILANTQGSQKKVSQEAIQSINETAEKALEKTKIANSQSLENLKDSQQKKLKEYQKLADEELKILGNKYDQESEELEKAIDEETKKFKKAHQEKLVLYQEEYMEKLRVVDEERYNKIKAIDDEIAAINNLTKAEQEAIELAEQNKKLTELKNKIDQATTHNERLKAEERFAEYQDSIARKKLLKEREAIIEGLKENKDTINKEYDLIEESIKKEYEDRKEKEIERYELESKNLKEQQKEKTKVLRTIYNNEKELIKERHDNETEKLRYRQREELKGLNSYHETALKNIDTRKKAELKALTEANIEKTKSSTLEDVNKALDELNKYADKTIYNFTEMTRNIGTFTAAGVDLETSVSAIKGIANLAAVSGSTSQQASTAMYQLSQALSSGTVKLMDWNSVVNAGMGGQVFQDALKETARVHGIAIDQMIAEEGSFRETLKTGWLTSEVLTETLSKFTGDLNEEQLRTMGYTEEQIKSIIKMGQTANDAATKVKTFTQLFDTLKEAAQSGWTESWEIIIGDFEEAKELLTGLSGVIGGFIDRTSDARNELLRLWKENGGREILIEAFRNSFEALGKIIKPISEAFRDIFPPTTSEQLLNLTNGLKTFTERLQIGDDTADKIKRTFAGLFVVLDMVKDAFLFVFKVAGQVFGLFGGPTAGGILELTARFGDFLVKLHDTAEAGNIFGRAFEKIQEIFTIVADKIKDAISRIGTAFQGFKSIDMGPLNDFSERSEKSLRPFTRLGEIFGAAFEAIVKVLEWAAPIVAKLGSIVGKGLGALADKVSYAVNNMEFNEILDLINTGLFGAILIGIKKFIDSLTEITSGAGGFLDGITGILDGVRGSLEAYQSSLKAKTLLTIASAIGILAAALVVLSLIDSEKLSTSLMAITVLFIELAAAMIVIKKAMGGGKMAKVSIQMVAIASAILILSTAMKNLAALDWEGVAKGTVGIAALAAVLVIAAKSLDKSSGKLIKGSTGLIAFSAAILILTHAVDNLAQLSWEELAKGLVGLTVILTEVVALTHLMGDPKRMISTGVGMIALGAAMLIFASAVEKMGQLSWGEISRGFIAMAGALTTITVSINLMPKGMINKATGMVIMGAALQIIANAMAKFGNMQWGEIARGLVSMAGALAAITIALNLMPKGMINKAIGLIGVATALQIMIGPLKQMAGMSWEEIAKGLITLGGSLLIITVAINAMTGGLAGAAAMLVMAAAIRVLTPALVSLGQMDLAEIGKALLALVGVFVVVGAAGLILAPLTPVLLALAGAIALLGIAVLAIGGGLLMFSAGLTALAVAGTAGAAALVVVVTSLLSLIPMALEKLGEGVVAFAKVISNGMPAIMEAVKQIALGLIQVLVEITPPVVEALLTFLVTLLEQLANAVPQMVDSGMRLLLGILDGIAAHIMEIVALALKIVSEFLRGIAEGIPDVIAAGVDIIVAFLTAIGQETPRVIDAGFKMIIDFVNGLADAIRENTPVLGKAMGNLAGAMIEGLVGGITGGIKSVVDSVKNLGKSVLDGLKSFLNNDIDTQPTIRPVLDLSDVESGTGRLNALFSRTQAMSISTGMSRVSDEEVQNGTNTSGKGNTYQFTQNNYSPKPLSRLEIYRQTKNQFSAMKGLVEA